MAARKLRTVAARPTWSRANVIDCRPGFDGPYFEAEGDENSVCGKCDSILVKGIVLAMLTLYLCCPSCGTYNMVDGGE